MLIWSGFILKTKALQYRLPTDYECGDGEPAQGAEQRLIRSQPLIFF